MTICVEQDIDGYLVASFLPVEECTQLVALSSAEYQYLTSHMEITGAEVVEFYSFGFALVFFGWIVSFPIRAALKAINLI